MTEQALEETHPISVIEEMARRNGVLIASFPRSGSTLLRNIITAIAREKFAGDRTITCKVTDIVPNYIEANARALNLARVFPIVTRTHDWEPIATNRTVFPFRRPEDSIYSYFSMAAKPAAVDTPDKFLRKVLPKWKAIAVAALEKRMAAPQDLCLFHYETYLSDPVEATQRVIDFIGLHPISTTADLVGKINSAFRKFDKPYHGPNDLQPQRGVSGGGQAKFSEEMTLAINMELMPLYEELRRLAGA